MKNKKTKKEYEEKKVLLIVNCPWYLYNFRIDLLKKLNQRGYKLILLSTKDQYSKNIKKYFYKVERLFLLRGSENLIFELLTLLNIFLCLLKHKPSLVHNFSIKPSIYGGIIGRLLGSQNILNHITGLGPLFYSNRLKLKLFNSSFQTQQFTVCLAWQPHSTAQGCSTQDSSPGIPPVSLAFLS